MIGAWLLYTGLWESAQEALDYFAFVRCGDHSGVTIPSQKRFVHYCERIKNYGPVPHIQLSLHRVVLHTFPKLGMLHKRKGGGFAAPGKSHVCNKDFHQHVSIELGIRVLMMEETDSTEMMEGQEIFSCDSLVPSVSRSVVCTKHASTDSKEAGRRRRVGIYKPAIVGFRHSQVGGVS